MDSLAKSKSDYWNKRLNRQAGTPPPTAQEFADELNRRMLTDPGAHGGIRFIVLQPQGAGCTLAWTGPLAAQPRVRQVLHAVAQELAMPAPFQMDPVPGAEHGASLPST